MLAPLDSPGHNLPSTGPVRFTKSHRARDEAKSASAVPCGAGPNALGPADYSYGLRARCRMWPPFRSTRLSLELA